MSALAANAQVPPDIAAKLRAIGPKIDLSVGAIYEAGRPYAYVFLKDHDHLSEGMAVGTADQSLTAPLLKWIRSTN